MKITELTLPKNQWELLISNSDKTEAGDELVDLVKTAYKNTTFGSFIKSVKDVIPSDWSVIDWDEDPDVDACVFYRHNRSDENWIGYKIQGIGHDGTQTSKNKAIAKVKELLGKKGVWIESSDAMRHILKKADMHSITDENMLRRLFNDNKLHMVNNDTYQRILSNGITVTETVFGNPILKDNS